MTHATGPEAHGTIIDWTVPSTGLDAAFGDGATRIEKALPNITALVGVTLVWWYAATTPAVHWQWWRYAVAGLLAYDLIGGVVANGLNSAKRFQHATQVAAPRRTAAFVRNHVLFAAAHVQPIVVAAVFAGTELWWGVWWYAVTLIAVALVPHVPLYVRRPFALMFVAAAPVVAMMMPAPLGFAWLPAVLIAKLVLGAVREEPYRPAPEGNNDGRAPDR